MYAVSFIFVKARKQLDEVLNAICFVGILLKHAHFAEVSCRDGIVHSTCMYWLQETNTLVDVIRIFIVTTQKKCSKGDSRSPDKKPKLVLF